MHIFCPLSDALVCVSYVGSKRGRKPWVMAVQTVFSTALCLCTSFDIMVGLWIYFFDSAMEVFSSNKYLFVWPLIINDLHTPFSGVSPLDCIVQGPAVLLSAGILFLRAWLALCLSVTLCFAQVASMDIPLLRRSVEFSYDEEAAQTKKTQ